jgi:hypothetical protein
VPAFESPELLELFQTYTAAPGSIGAHFAQTAARAHQNDPLIVATGTDLALYPGDGSAPSVEGFRMSTRGFKELAGISHLGPALATLARMKELDESSGWRSDAERLLDVTKAARAANSTELWRDRIAVKAFVGRENAIAAMVDYSCRQTERFLQRALDDRSYLTATTLRRDYLEGPAPSLVVPFNRVMVATFFLTGMDIAHRIIAWFQQRRGCGQRSLAQSAPGASAAHRAARAGLSPIRRDQSRHRGGAGGRISTAVVLAARHLRAWRADVRWVPAFRAAPTHGSQPRGGSRQRP